MTLPTGTDHGPSRLRRLGIFLGAVVGSGILSALVEWTVRWVLPAPAAVFTGRAAEVFLVFYWMPVVLAESPPWTRRRRVGFAGAAAVGVAALARLLG